MKCPRCKRLEVVAPRLMTDDDGKDHIARWCPDFDGCGFDQSRPAQQSDYNSGPAVWEIPHEHDAELQAALKLVRSKGYALPGDKA